MKLLIRSTLLTFANIGNHLCFWRDTGARVGCPAPEPECEGGK
jgi:hypothetical protein